MDRQERAIMDATWSYYHDGLNQNQIAERMGISRASVVNYLAEARKRDYVRISINPRVFTEHKLADELTSHFKLKSASVVAASGTTTEERVAKMAAEWLPHLLQPQDRLGVAWGETIFQVADAAPQEHIDDLEVVQLVGSRPSAKGFAAEICSAVLARQFGARCVNLHVPLVLSNEALRAQLLAEPVIQSQMAAVMNCNKVLFACGTCTSDSHIVKTGLMDAAELASHVANGAVGVICGRLINHQGEPVKSESETRMVGVSLDDMKGKETGLLVGSGEDRVEPILAAIRGGYVTHLATCDETAARLLSQPL